jgi:hypothetical protein
MHWDGIGRARSAMLCTILTAAWLLALPPLRCWVLSLRPCPAEQTSTQRATSPQHHLEQRQQQQATQALQQQLALPKPALLLLLLPLARRCGWRGRRVRRARACVRCGG